jgi:predicted acyltransferase
MQTLSTTEVPAVESLPATPSARVMSVDALRGFDMFWIIGAGSLVHALSRMAPNPGTEFFKTQLEHAFWEGFRFYDLIFPLFIFLSGVSMAYSLGRSIEQNDRRRAIIRILRRGALLYLIGIFYNGGVAGAWPDIRLSGVLNLIAVSYVLAGLLFCFVKPRLLPVCCVVLLGVYWAVLTFVPVRDITLTRADLAARAEASGDLETAALFKIKGNPSAIKDSPAWGAAQRMYDETTTTVRGSFDRGRNVSNHMDFRRLPGRLVDDFFEAQGILSPLSGAVICLSGALGGLLLRRKPESDWQKVGMLLAFGIGCVALGWLWSLQIPVIKKIWTPSYVLVAVGYSACLLGVFYAVVDIWKVRTWCQPFVWMGMNPITIYLVVNMLGGFGKLSARLAGGDVKAFMDSKVAQGFGDLFIAIVGLLLAFWLVHFLYRRKIFLRL